jgi:hypothetical protein
MRILFALAALAMAPVVTFGQTPGTGLASTAHDFVAGPAAVGNVVATGVGLCTFCHTPQRAIGTRLVWNHTLSTNTFSWSDASTTTGGTTLRSITPTSQGASVRCLSCHDGTVAIGDVAMFDGQPRNGANALNAMKMRDVPGEVNNQFVITGGGSGGADLKGNHPVGIPFPFNNAPSNYNGINTGPAVDLAEWRSDPTANGIRLFHDAGAGAIGAGPAVGRTGIECSSCHDPHNGKSVPSGSALFLRGNIGGSGPDYLCGKCHKK